MITDPAKHCPWCKTTTPGKEVRYADRTEIVCAVCGTWLDTFFDDEDLADDEESEDDQNTEAAERPT